MSDWLDETRGRRDGVTIPTIWIAFALSLLFHAAVMWKWLPHIRLPSLEDAKRIETDGTLIVHLAPPPSPPPSPSSPPSASILQAKPSPALKAQPPITMARPAPAPPVIALNQPTPGPTPPPTEPPVAAPAPVRPPVAGDLASFIEARRRARGDPTPAAPQPAEDDNARANRIAAGNLTTQRQLTFGYDPRQGGGVFQINRVNFDEAEFTFFGWNKDIRRNTKQLIEVRRGNNSDIRIAVVRKMIAIIREYEQTDFLWESRRLNRNLILSARAADNAGLEDFMMREFFPDPRPSAQ